MNKHQRVRAAMAGQEVDQVPSGFWLHFSKEQSIGRAAIDAHLDFYRQTDVDLLKVMNETLYRMPSPVSSAADWAGWKPLRAHDNYFQAQVDVVKAVADKVGGEVPILATIHGAFISTHHGSKRPEDILQGPNPITQYLRESPADVMPALAAVSDALIELSYACLEAGADGIYYGSLGGEAHRFDEQTFVDYVKPWDLKILRALEQKTDLLVLHICKDSIRLPLYADYPGNAVNWAVHESDYSMATGRAVLGKTILGGLDDRSGVMIDGSESEIRTAVHDVIADFGRQGLILGADCTLPNDFPLERIRVAVEAARSA